MFSPSFGGRRPIWDVVEPTRSSERTQWWLNQQSMPCCYMTVGFPSVLWFSFVVFVCDSWEFSHTLWIERHTIDEMTCRGNVCVLWPDMCAVAVLNWIHIFKMTDEWWVMNPPETQKTEFSIDYLLVVDVWALPEWLIVLMAMASFTRHSRSRREKVAGHSRSYFSICPLLLFSIRWINGWHKINFDAVQTSRGSADSNECVHLSAFA